MEHKDKKEIRNMDLGNLLGKISRIIMGYDMETKNYLGFGSLGSIGDPEKDTKRLMEDMKRHLHIQEKCTLAFFNIVLKELEKFATRQSDVKE